jgi:hypothetical protein
MMMMMMICLIYNLEGAGVMILGQTYEDENNRYGDIVWKFNTVENRDILLCQIMNQGFTSYHTSIL